MTFAHLADLISQDPDYETYVFRSFSKLAVRTVLQLQSELSFLEEKQCQLDEEATRLPTNQHLDLLTKWESIEKLDQDTQTDEHVKKHILLADEIATKLERYYRLLELQAQVAKHAPPSKRALKAYRRLFYGKDGKQEQIVEPMVETALKSETNDYIAICPPADRDVLSRYLRDHLSGPSKDIYSDEEGRVKSYSGSWLSTLATVCSIAISAVLLLVSILLLYFFKAPDVRLALVLAFIVLFATGISISTAATRDSVFAATAAYAAVLIVFVSGNLGNTNTGSFVGFMVGNGSNSTIILNGTIS